MGGRDHSCEGCGRGGLNDPDGRCECDDALPRAFCVDTTFVVIARSAEEALDAVDPDRPNVFHEVGGVEPMGPPDLIPDSPAERYLLRAQREERVALTADQAVLLRQVQEAREDPAFRDRLMRLMCEDRALLDSLRASERLREIEALHQSHARFCERHVEACNDEWLNCPDCLALQTGGTSYQSGPNATGARAPEDRP